MYLRDLPDLTLADLREHTGKGRHHVISRVDEVKVSLDEDEPTITLRDDIIVEASPSSLEVLSGLLGVPSSFYRRLDADLRQHLTTEMLSRSKNDAIRWTYNDWGLTEARDPEKQVIEPEQLVDVAMNVVTGDAQVVEYVDTPAYFKVDTIVPAGFERGSGGDKKVGDITSGGITIEQNRKQNLVPTVGSYLYRLQCTNGMVGREESDRVDARGLSVEAVLSELEALAQRLFSRVESQIASFYELRAEPVPNPERVIFALGDEHGLTPRMIASIAQRVPSYEPIAGEGGDWTMFDVVNLMTNQANDPSLHNKVGSRRHLELTGGEIVSDHAQRCITCQHRIAAP